MELGFFVPNDVGSAMTLDLIWEPWIHRPLTGFGLSLKREETGDVRSDRPCWRLNSRRSRLREDLYTEFSWGVLSGSQPGKAKAAPVEAEFKLPCSWSHASWCGLSELTQIMAKRPELDISHQPATGCRLPPGKGHGQGSIVSLPSSATPNEGMSPDISHHWSHRWGRSAESGVAGAVQHDWQLGVLPRGASVRTWMPANEMRSGGEQTESGRTWIYFWTSGIWTLEKKLFPETQRDVNPGTTGIETIVDEHLPRKRVDREKKGRVEPRECPTEGEEEAKEPTKGEMRNS